MNDQRGEFPTNFDKIFRILRVKFQVIDNPSRDLVQATELTANEVKETEQRKTSGMTYTRINAICGL